jgi:hypothetical protein
MPSYKSVSRYQVENVNAVSSADTRQRRIDKATALFVDGSTGENACRADCARPRRRPWPDAAGVNRKGQ